MPPDFTAKSDDCWDTEDNNDVDVIDVTNANVWMEIDQGTYAAAHSTTPLLPPGMYDIIDTFSGPIFKRVSTNSEQLVQFDDALYLSVMRDIERFWTCRDIFANHGMTYKRGILLHGPPGTGKSCLTRMLVDDVVKRGGIGVMFGGSGAYVKGMNVLRKVQPDVPVIVVMEDIDAILHRSDESHVLNVLDGVYRIDNVVYLATTNYPQLLGERIKNRPSRFDRRISIGYPGAPMRKQYLTNINRMGLLTPEVIDAWVNDTDGLTLAHIRELFVSVVILEKDYQETLNELRSMYDECIEEPVQGPALLTYGGSDNECECNTCD